MRSHSLAALVPYCARRLGRVCDGGEVCARECPFTATAVAINLASRDTNTDERGRGHDHRVAAWSSRDLGYIGRGCGCHDRLLGSGWHHHHESGPRQSADAGHGRRRGAHTTKDIPWVPACRRANARCTSWGRSAPYHSIARVIGDQSRRRLRRAVNNMNGHLQL